MKRILVLCTGNSCRSQMAHGYINHFGNGNLEVRSAGVETHGVNPIAIGVMEEDGVSIASHKSELVDDYMNETFDLVVTVCDNAKEACPYFPGAKEVVHHSFTDPAYVSGTANEVIASFRKVRDEIKAYSKNLVDSLN